VKVALLRCIVVLGVACLAIVMAAPSRAEDAPRAVVDDLHAALIEVMKSGTALGFSGRYQNLDPAVARTFNLAAMTRLAVGPTWTSFSDDQKARVSEAFHRFSVATYAGRFVAYDGERFESDPEPLQTQNGTMVRSAIVEREGDRVALNYLLRQYDGAWRIIDVFLSGTISELATRRNEFSAILQRGGAEALIATLDGKAQEMAAPR
jgi:phospholipid transport system substrate-binding protein